MIEWKSSIVWLIVSLLGLIALAIFGWLAITTSEIAWRGWIIGAAIHTTIFFIAYYFARRREKNHTSE